MDRNKWQFLISVPKIQKQVFSFFQCCNTANFRFISFSLVCNLREPIFHSKLIFGSFQIISKQHFPQLCIFCLKLRCLSRFAHTFIASHRLIELSEVSPLRMYYKAINLMWQCYQVFVYIVGNEFCTSLLFWLKRKMFLEKYFFEMLCPFKFNLRIEIEPKPNSTKYE